MWKANRLALFPTAPEVNPEFSYVIHGHITKYDKRNKYNMI
jgi:hypothetical protein